LILYTVLIRYKRYEDQLVKTKANNRSAQEEFVAEVRPSESGLDPEIIGSENPDPGRPKLFPRKEKWRNFIIEDYEERELPLK
jgi:hypothetical protein